MYSIVKCRPFYHLQKRLQTATSIVGVPTHMRGGNNIGGGVYHGRYGGTVMNYGDEQGWRYEAVGMW